MGGQGLGITSERVEMNKLMQRLKAFLAKDISSKKLLYIKASLFGLTGSLAGGIIFAMKPTLWTAILLVITTWSFCRLYYFFFYVIDKYIDPSSRHSSLSSFTKSYFNRNL